MLADPSWDFHEAFARYKGCYQIPLEATIQCEDHSRAS